jgi:hypothetical protein
MAIKENNLTDAAKLIAGQTLTIPVNINTPVPTKRVTPTVTVAPTTTSTKAS